MTWSTWWDTPTQLIGPNHAWTTGTCWLCGAPTPDTHLGDDHRPRTAGHAVWCPEGTGTPGPLGGTLW